MNQAVLFFKNRNWWQFFIILAVGMGVLLGDYPAWSQETDAQQIAVMPFIKGKNPENVEDTFSCPYSQFCFENDSIQDGSARVLTGMLQEILEKEFNGRTIPLGQAAEVFDILKIDDARDTPESVLLKMGDILGADYMMGGNVWRYRDREGTAFSVQTPASVAFAVYLVDMKTRKVIWSGSYDKTQQALTENLLNAKDFFKQGARWLTADELARFGMNKVFQDFPLK